MKKILNCLFVSLLLFAVIIFAGSCTKKKQEQKKLVYYSMWNQGEPQAVVIQKAIEEFQKQYPGTSIEVTWKGRGVLANVRNALAAGEQIDLFDADGNALAALTRKNDVAILLNDFINEESYDKNGKLKDTLFDKVFEPISVEGNIHTIPYLFSPMFFFYNKEIFDEVGIEKPLTWEEFLNAGEKIKAAGYDFLAVESDIQFYNLLYFTSILNVLEGKGFIRSLAEDKTGEKWRHPSVIKAISMERELWEKGYIPKESKGYKWPAAQTRLATGKAAAELAGSWLPTELQKTTKDGFKWGAFAFPSILEGDTNKKIVEVGTQSISIQKNTQYLETSKLFIKFLLSKKIQENFSQEALSGPVNKDVEWPEDIIDAYKLIKNGEIEKIIDGLSIYHPEYLTDLLYQTHNSMFLGDISTDEFINKMIEGTKNYWKERKN